MDGRLQVFTGNPRGWALSEGRPAEDAAFREGCLESGIRVVVHAPYLVNLGSPTPLTYERSTATVAHNVRRAVEIGAEGVVVHTGSYVAESDRTGLREAALARVREALLPVLDTLLGSRIRRGTHETSLPAEGLLPTGIPELDAFIGGLPRGRACEILGPASAGKTTLRGSHR